MLNGNGSDGVMPPAVPLRKSGPALHELGIGKLVKFSPRCPLPPLAGAEATVITIRSYRFGADVLKSYQLSVRGAKHYFLTVAEDDQGQYLGLSRQLSTAEQDIWFGHDALSFFTEASSAKSIRCKADLMTEGEWAAARYAKTVDWVEGSISPNESRLTHTIHYSLLVNEAGDKALEIEHEDQSGDNRFFITVYRPVEDIVSVVAREVEAPSAIAPAKAANDDVPLFKEPSLTTPPAAPAPVVEMPLAQPKQRQDFRRLAEASAEIHIERTPVAIINRIEQDEALPSFLIAQEQKAEMEYLSLDEVIPPEPEKIRVGLTTAQVLITRALEKNVRVRDVLRDMVGLSSGLSEEVMFEMPLSEEDYHTLAMRYKLRPDHRIEIRSRLEDELRAKLGAPRA